MFGILLCGLAILAIALLAWCMQRHAEHLPAWCEEDANEVDASFDALQAERDEAAKRHARAVAHERAMHAAHMAVIAKYGRLHAPVEL